MKKFLLILTVVFSLVVLVPTADAQNRNTNRNANTTRTTTTTTTSGSSCDELRKKFENNGGGDVLNALPAYCSTAGIFNKIVSLLYWLIGIASVIMIIIGGYMYMTARGNDAQVTKARSIITWAIIGLVVAILAAVIVNVVVAELLKSR